MHFQSDYFRFMWAHEFWIGHFQYFSKSLEPVGIQLWGPPHFYQAYEFCLGDSPIFPIFFFVLGGPSIISILVVYMGPPPYRIHRLGRNRGVPPNWTPTDITDVLQKTNWILPYMDTQNTYTVIAENLIELIVLNTGTKCLPSCTALASIAASFYDLSKDINAK